MAEKSFNNCAVGVTIVWLSFSSSSSLELLPLSLSESESEFEDEPEMERTSSSIFAAFCCSEFSLFFHSSSSIVAVSFLDLEVEVEVEVEVAHPFLGSVALNGKNVGRFFPLNPCSIDPPHVNNLLFLSTTAYIPLLPALTLVTIAPTSRNSPTSIGLQDISATNCLEW